MAHPFSKMFEAALKKSSDQENFVLAEAEKLKKKGYSTSEIYSVLKKLHASLIDDNDALILREAVEEFSRYIEE